MQVRFTHLICIVIGILLVVGMLWIFEQKKNNGFNGQSTIAKLVFKEQESNRTLINNKKTDKTSIEDFKAQIDKAIVILKAISYTRSVDPGKKSEVIQASRTVFNTLEQARGLTFRLTYVNSNQIDNSINKELDISSANINSEFFNSAQPIYAYFKDSTANPWNILAELFTDTQTGLKNRISTIIATLSNESARLTTLAAKTNEVITEFEKNIKEQDDSLTELEKSSKDRLLMVVVLPTFAIIIVLLFIVPYIYRQNSDIITRLFEDRVILKIFTVFILVISILLLGIGNKVNGETLGTLLGGVSVYVLQNTLGARREGNEE